MSDRAFIVTSDTGTPWRIPGPRTGPSTVPEHLENTCGVEGCDGRCHAPDQTVKFTPCNPLERLLQIPRGGH